MNCPSCRTENLESASSCASCGTDFSATAVVVTVDLKPGAVFDRRYEILGPLGRGGMGMVYKARDRSLDEVVAIKVLRPDFAQDPRMAERFKTEIRLARRVRHRNVCAIHDYGEDRGLLYISMEMIDGVDLKQLLREKGGLPPEEAYDVSIQLAEGLQAVHDAGIIHRDLKTPNIMRDTRGVARLMDFGIAKRQGEGTLTATGNIVGTPEYMSPEQAQGGRNVTFRSDLYALGVVIYEVFSGRVPFKGDTPISTILMHINDPPPLEGQAASRLPRELRPVLRRCLAKDPADRYDSARAVAETLREARSPSRRQQPVPTEVLEAPTLRRRRRGRPRAVLQTFLLAVPAGAIAGGLLLLRQGGRLSPPPSTLATLASPAPAVPPATTPAATIPASAAVAPVRTAPAPRPAVEPKATRPPRPSPSAPLANKAVSPPAKSEPLTAAPSSPASSLPSPPSSPPPRSVAPEPGTLQVVVRPWGEVHIDGRSVGTTPLDRISLGAGTHVIKVRHPAYEPLERSVTIRSGQLERLVVDFPTEGTRRP